MFLVKKKIIINFREINLLDIFVVSCKLNELVWYDCSDESDVSYVIVFYN